MSQANKTVSFKLPRFMKGIPIDKREVINSQLLVDVSIDVLASRIQKDWELCLDISHSGLMKALQRYKNTQIVPKQAQIATKLSSNEHIAKIAALNTIIDNTLKPVHELERLALIQRKRVDKILEKEENLPMLLDAVTKNINQYQSMLKDLSALHISLGILRRVPKKENTGLTQEQHEFVKNLKQPQLPHQATVDALAYLRDNGFLPGGVPAAAVEEGEELPGDIE